MNDAGVDPAPQRNSQIWATFLRTQAEAILAADLLEAVTLTGKRMYVLAVIEHATMFDTTLAAAGITVVLSGVRMPRMNAIMKRWIQT